MSAVKLSTHVCLSVPIWLRKSEALRGWFGCRYVLMSWEEKHQLFPQNAAKTSRKKFPPSTAWDGDIFLFRLPNQTNLCHSNGENSICEVYFSIPSHQCVKTSWIETWRFEIANLGGSPWVEQTSREAGGVFSSCSNYLGRKSNKAFDCIFTEPAAAHLLRARHKSAAWPHPKPLSTFSGVIIIFSTIVITMLDFQK